MDLTHPLRSLAPSLDADVLEVLARSEQGLGLSHITRLSARGTRQGITHVIDRMVEHGIVIAEPANHGHLYRLNRDHLLCTAILEATSARSRLLTQLGDRSASMAPSPVHVSIFGSFARGEAGPSSDIDVLVLTKNESELRTLDDQLVQFAADIERSTGNRCQILRFTTTRCRKLMDTHEPIVEEWLADSILLHGRELTELLPARAAGGPRGIARTARH